MSAMVDYILLKVLASQTANAAPRFLESLLDFHRDLGVILTSCA
jgi:hypothetical protein